MWEIGIGDQALTFLLSLVLGALLCAFYDVFRALRKTVKHGAVAVFFEDMLFWVISAFICFIFLLARTGGGLRGYVGIGAIIGFFAFRFSFSKITLPLILSVFKILVSFWGFLCDSLARFILLCRDSVFTLLRFCLKILKKGAKRVKKLLKSRVDMLYTKKNSD